MYASFLFRFLLSVFVLWILCCLIQSRHGETIKCVFRNVHYGSNGAFYSCDVNSLYNSNNDMIIENYRGEHQSENTYHDVKGYYIHDTDTKFIPGNLSSLFVLTYFSMWYTKLLEIKSKDFQGMKNLEYLSLKENELTSLPMDTFSTLANLKFIMLNANKIEGLPNGIFDHNTQLKYIHISDNNILFIGSTVFDRQTNLLTVDARENICVDKEYEGRKDIRQLKYYIKNKCNFSNDVMLIEIKKMIFDQQSGQQSGQEKDHQKDQIEVNELKRELSEGKIEKQKIQVELNNVKTELLELKNQQQTNQVVFRQDLTFCQDTNSFNINCEFSNTNSKYSCETSDLTINSKNMELNQVIGTHLRFKSNRDVLELIITNAYVLFLSNDIFKTFFALETLLIYDAQLKKLSKDDFVNATNLKTLEVKGNEIRSLGNNLFGGANNLEQIEMDSNEIDKIFINTFQGLYKLKKLSLKNNSMTELQPGTFQSLKNLKTLNLSSNKFKSLDGKLLQFNTKLLNLYFNDNNLNEIGVDILNYATNLKNVDFSDNKCIDENSADTNVENIIDEIKNHCNLYGKCGFLSSIMNILI